MDINVLFISIINPLIYTTIKIQEILKTQLILNNKITILCGVQFNYTRNHFKKK